MILPSSRTLFLALVLFPTRRQFGSPCTKQLGSVSPTSAPTEETFVLSYSGSVAAGFGGAFEGNEITLTFMVSPYFEKEISLLLPDCATPIPGDIMNVTAYETDAGNGGNLKDFNVSLALNLTKLGSLKVDGNDDEVWKGADDTTKVLTFCVRVDLVFAGDLVVGDETTSAANKTSVQFESVVLEVAVDFSSEVPAIAGVTGGVQEAEEDGVIAEIDGVTGCHCEAATDTCYHSNNVDSLQMDCSW